MSTSKKAEENLDDTLEHSFPASDPSAQSQPVKKVGALKGRSADEKLLDDGKSGRAQKKGKRRS
jgi:hypothetical protein